MKVLIVGAGPSGLTTAVELARQGIMPYIVDKRDSASTLSRAVGITPRSLQLLSYSGVSERLIAEGIAMDGACIYRGEKLLLKLPLHSKKAFFPTLLSLPQDRTEAIMADGLESLGCSVHYSLGLESFIDQKDQVVAQFSDGREEAFDMIVGADGIRSTVRQTAAIDYSGVDLEETWSIADVDAEDWQHAREFTLVQAGPGIAIVVVPLSTTRYRVVASHKEALDVLPLPLNVTNIRRQGTFKISVRQAQTYSKGRVHLVGDAAHCHSPVGGRGMNLGIADGVELAQRIAENTLEGYSSLRHAEGAQVIRTTERGRNMVMGLNWRTRLTFRTLMTLTNITGPLKRVVGRFLVEF